MIMMIVGATIGRPCRALWERCVAVSSVGSYPGGAGHSAMS